MMSLRLPDSSSAKIIATRSTPAARYRLVVAWSGSLRRRSLIVSPFGRCPLLSRIRAGNTITQTRNRKKERLTAMRRATRETRCRRIILRSLKKKAAEQQDAEDDHNRDNDEFDQRHFHAPELARKFICDS